MDQRTTEEDRKRELIARLAASRVQVQVGRARLKENLNPFRRARNAISKRPVKTFAITAGAAFAISLLRKRPGKSRRPTSFKGFLLRSGFKLAQPAIRLWLLKLAKQRFVDPHTAKYTQPHQDTP